MNWRGRPSTTPTNDVLQRIPQRRTGTATAAECPIIGGAVTAANAGRARRRTRRACAAANAREIRLRTRDITTNKNRRGTAPDTARAVIAAAADCTLRDAPHALSDCRDSATA